MNIGLFDPMWFPVFWLIHFHLTWASMTIYLHRTIAHNLITCSKSLTHVFRFFIWTAEKTFPKYADVYRYIHRTHHRNSDTEKDPHSPHYKTHKEIANGWKIPDGVKLDTNLTPTDWIEKNLYEPYYQYGHWVMHVLSLILFGIWGFLGSIAMWALTRSWLIICVTITWPHKFGFRYAGNRNPTDRSHNLLPWGVLFAGEELHANHHNQPGNPNFAHRWFEIDVGYFYIKLFQWLGMISINNNKEQYYESRTI